MGLKLDIFFMCCGLAVMVTAAVDIMINNMQVSFGHIIGIVTGGILFFVSMPRDIAGPQGGPKNEA
jgi:hypothetical protein